MARARNASQNLFGTPQFCYSLAFNVDCSLWITSNCISKDMPSLALAD